MEELQHFSHNHLLTLVQLRQLYDNDNGNSDDEEEKEDEKSNFVMEDPLVGRCNMCEEQIHLFHTCYYKCTECAYALHKFCAELPLTLQNHVLHPGHHLILSKGYQHVRDYNTSEYEWKCPACSLMRKNFYNYYCSICVFTVDIICVTMHKQKMNHPCHPHQLQRMLTSMMVSNCCACGKEHKGTFYHCTTCVCFVIGLDCALLPKKLLIQQHTDGTFVHSHPLTLDYSFPYIEMEAKFFPHCKVCDTNFYSDFWRYKCDKCRYYVHVDCATSMRDSFMSILLPAGRGKIYTNLKDEDLANVLHCPFPDESYSLVKHHFSNQMDFRVNRNDRKMLNHSSHKHPLVHFDMQSSPENKPVSLHNSIKKTQLLCDGCVKPITTMPFYKCCQDIQNCGFVLHEWCAWLPPQVQIHPAHPQHTLLLLPKVHGSLFGLFVCDVCSLVSNGFAYRCTECECYVDVNCAFLPTKITHEAHPNHLLSIITKHSSNSLSNKWCNSCSGFLDSPMALHCPSCDFYLHIDCAFLLPKMIRHKFDKHPLSLRYDPVENHINEYFCEICECEFDPECWFYHCTKCAQSVHPYCAPLILEYGQPPAYSKHEQGIFRFINIKFGRTLKIKGHSHILEYVRGAENHLVCDQCHLQFQSDMVVKCLECESTLDFDCAWDMAFDSE